MKNRIFSQVVRRRLGCTLVCLSSFTVATHVGAQDSGGSQNTAGLMVHPETGVAYRQTVKTIERPVYETTMEKRNQTVYTPKTIVESTPENRTVYSPVVEYKWEPRLHGRWNPFQRPTVAYHHVPETSWRARNEVVERTQTRTDWVAEHRTIEVPKTLVRMQREQKVEYEPVGRVAEPASPSQGFASQLRPMPADARVVPLSGTSIAASANFQSSRLAATTVGRMTSDPPRRNPGQGGMRANELYPTSAPAVHGQALPPSNNGIGVATLPSLPFMR